MISSFDPKELPTAKLHEYLLGSIAPRPIAWVSTVDNQGNVNLAPYSFFNVFGSNPPTLIFSPSRRVRDNSTKDTLHNCLETMECVVNICSAETLYQMVLSSADYPSEISEFEKTGLTQEPSIIVKAPRVKEAVAQFECKVQQVISTGEHGGAGQLVICEVVYCHLQDYVFNEEGKLDPFKVNNIGRLGGLWYTAAKDGLFIQPNPKANTGIDLLPEVIKNSYVLTGFELSALSIYENKPEGPFSRDESKHHEAKELIKLRKVAQAWESLLE